MSFGVDFDLVFENEFIASRGEPVIHEIAVLCPCAGTDDLSTHDQGAPLMSCDKCLGLGYFFRKPKRIIGLVVGVSQRHQYSEYSAKLFPGDCSFSPAISERKIGQYDKITFTKPQPLHEGQIIMRGAAHLGTNEPANLGLDLNEDRLWYQSAGVTHVESLDSSQEYREGADFEIVGRAIRWFPGAMPDRTRYVIKYSGYLEWIVFDPPFERRDAGQELGQRVFLRKLHVFNRRNDDASKDTAAVRESVGGVYLK